MVIVRYDDVDPGDTLIWCLASLEDNIVVRHLVNALKSLDEYDLFTFLNVGR